VSTARKVLLLNASEEILKVINWQHATKLMLAGKARKPHGHSDEYEIKTMSGVFRLPTALVLVRYVHIPYKNAAVNKVNVIKRENYICGYCSRKLTNSTGTVDHVVPQSRGGKNKWTNVVASCKSCNNKKDSLSVSEFEKKYNKKLKIKPHVPSRDFLILVCIDSMTDETWTRWVEV